MAQITNKTLVEKALGCLLDSKFEPILDMVITKSDKESFLIANSKGKVEFRRFKAGENYQFEILDLEGNNPVQNQDPSYLSKLSDQLNLPYPKNEENSYPYAFENIAQVWDHEHAPDIVCVHSASHNWEEEGGHLGEHGSLGVIQMRAPFIIGGCGIKKSGCQSGHCRVTDVAPSILKVLGAKPLKITDDTEFFLKSQQGKSLDSLFSGDKPELVIGFLLDGSNSAVLYNLIDQKQLPALGYITENGTWLSDGMLATFPSVTLPNHTAIMTSSFPGEHKILHNAWYDRESDCQIVTESPATWHTAMNWLSPNVETIWQALARNFPEEIFISINEPADKGATYSTFDLFRSNRLVELMPDLTKPPSRTNLEFFNGSENYKNGSYADEVGLRQVIEILRGSFLGQSYKTPKLLWYSMTVTDAAFHHGGPYSEIARASIIDSDKRISEVLNLLSEKQLLEKTMFLVVADHGMQISDKSVKGNWGQSLKNAGIAFRDESYGFIYLL